MKQLSLILLVACVACSASPNLRDTAPAGSSDALPTQMRALVGAAPCTETAQCKTVALGARPCGGPEGYLAYSTAHTDAGRLQALAARFAEQRRAEAAKSGELSTCQFMPDPGAQCRAGACVLGAGASNAR